MLSPKSEIPDDEILYRYCNPNAFPEEQVDIPTSIFLEVKNIL